MESSTSGSPGERERVSEREEEGTGVPRACPARDADSPYSTGRERERGRSSRPLIERERERERGEERVSFRRPRCPLPPLCGQPLSQQPINSHSLNGPSLSLIVQKNIHDPFTEIRETFTSWSIFQDPQVKEGLLRSTSLHACLCLSLSLSLSLSLCW